MKNDKEKSQIIIYKDFNGDIKLDVFLENETVWINQEQMALLFAKARRTIGEHIQNIFVEGELDENSTRRKFRQVQVEGGRKVMREIDFYNKKELI